MQTADFISSRLPTVDAVELVAAHPDCTLAELLRHTEAGRGDRFQQEAARHQLNQTLFAAVATGDLELGPTRRCPVRRVIVSTWRLAQHGTPGLASEGLGILEDLMRQAITLEPAAA